jgi:transketolase
VSTDTRAVDELCVNTIRTLSMDAVEQASSGHPGTPMALAPLAHVLFTRIMHHNPANQEWHDRDRFVLSVGHASMLLYSALYLSGYGLTIEEIKNFRQLESPTAGHPERKYAAGIETTTGPLGQGISTAVGIALAERMLAARFNREGHELVDHHTFVIASDGDMQEGISSEACSLAGHLGLGRLVVFYDDNHISIEGDTELSFSEDVGKRFEAYGWHVENLGEETDLDALEAAALRAKAVEDRPSLVILRTHIATGAPNMQGTKEAHGSPLGEEEIRLTKEAYGWPSDEPFHVPDEVLERYAAVGERGAEAEREWKERAEAYRSEHPDLWEWFDQTAQPRMPEGLHEGLPRFDHLDEKGEEPQSIATRKASEQVIQWAAAAVPSLVGGSADLAPSTNTLIADGGDVGPHAYGGRNLHFGIREHAMGAVVNGLNLHGLRGYGATFLLFSDYMRGSIRLAALMKLPSIFVFTHDSIGVGEDGPTHQPVEQLPGLRAVPRLCVLRPADANETALCWQFALEQHDRPSAMALTRQGLPILDRDTIPDDAVRRGAYVLRDAADGDPQLILIATGSEVSLCLEARERLEADGVATRVVSMPCVERFAEQDAEYRDEVLPPGCRARLAVEAASPLGWDRWVGIDGEVHAMESFGESGKTGALFEYFGFTPERVAERGQALLERLGSGLGPRP